MTPSHRASWTSWRSDPGELVAIPDQKVINSHFGALRESYCARTASVRAKQGARWVLTLLRERRIALNHNDIMVFCLTLYSSTSCSHRDRTLVASLYWAWVRNWSLTVEPMASLQFPSL